MSRFMSERLSSLKPYTPGEQPLDKKYIKLNTNESPYPPSPAVVNAINKSAIEDLKLYSDPDLRRLRGAIAKYYGVPEGCVFCGNGSDEVLSFAFQAWGSDNGVAYPDISYGFYSVFADLYSFNSKVIPLDKDFHINLNDYYGFNGLIVFANPNAPTGLFVPVGEIKRLAKNNPDSVILVDEAYVDFGAESALSLIFEHDNVVVVRTFSKSRQMAGARLGYAFACEALINDLNTIKFSFNPYNVNRLTAIAGAESVMDGAYFEECKAKIIKTRENLKQCLRSLGFSMTDSVANFVFVKHPDICGKQYYEALKERGILVRHFSAERIDQYVRITVGTDDEINALVAATVDILQEAK